MRTHPVSTRTTLILAAIVLLAPLVNSFIVRGLEMPITETGALAADHPAASLERESPT